MPFLFCLEMLALVTQMGVVSLVDKPSPSLAFYFDPSDGAIPMPEVGELFVFHMASSPLCDGDYIGEGRMPWTQSVDDFLDSLSDLELIGGC